MESFHEHHFAKVNLKTKTNQEEKEIMKAKSSLKEEEIEEGKSPSNDNDEIPMEQPFLSRPWNSSTELETVMEVENLTVKQERDLIEIMVEWITDESMFKIGIKKHQDMSFNTYDPANPDVKYSDQAVQSVAPTTESYSQTTWRRKVNTSTQSDPPRLGSDDRRSILESESMANFIKLVHPIMEEALQERDAFDIFRNAFPLMNSERERQQGDDDAPIAKTCENGFNELGSFIDTEQKEKVFISAISWVPKLQGIVAVSTARSVSFEQCVVLRNHAEPSYISIWDIRELSRPILKLTSPHDVLCFRFNSSRDSSVVVAGLANGQVAMWGIKNAKELGNYHHIEGSTVKHVNRVHPVAISDITNSHNKSILDMAWLPSGIQVDYHGNLLGSEHIDGNSYQFITVAADGLCIFWDTRYQEIAKGQLPHVSRRPRASSDESQSSVLWKPLLSLRLSKLEGVGDLALSRLIVTTWKGEQKDEPHIICGTGEGEIVLADWRPRPPSTISTENGNITGTGSSIRSSAKMGGNVSAADFVKWVASDNVSSCVTLQESPFFKGVVLSAGNWTFKLWHIDCQQLIFTSPMATACISTARWSPTRPGVILLGKVDGSVDMWDLADTSLAPIITFPACSSLITAMEFINYVENESSSNSAQQMLAIGDGSGHLHVFYVPEAISREVSGELLSVISFLSRKEKKEETATETNDKISMPTTPSKEINKEKNRIYDSPPDIVFEATQQTQIPRDPAIATDDNESYKALEARFREEYAEFLS